MITQSHKDHKEGRMKMKIEQISIDKLTPYPANAKAHPPEQVERIARSIEAFGFKVPLLCDADNVIVAGHGRYLAAQKLGLAEVPVIRCDDLTPDQIRAFRIADNKVAESEWIEEILAAEIQALAADHFDTDLLGFTADELAAIQPPKDGLTDPDDIPDIPEDAPPITQPGDLWLLGEHRVLCADCTNRENVHRLMDGKQADMVFTDPPYGVSYADKNRYLNVISPRNRIQIPIEHDHVSEKEIMALWKACFEVIRDNLAPVNSYYITGPQIQGMMMMMMMMQEAGLPYRHVIIWVKNNHVLGRCDYYYKHEPIFFGWTTKHKFYARGPFKTSVWPVDKPLKNDLHPTMKPVDLIINALLNSSKQGDICLDPFLGSGSTLIACERLGRVCYGMEIDPHYCDVIVKRWEDYTGQKAARNP